MSEKNNHSNRTIKIQPQACLNHDTRGQTEAAIAHIVGLT